MAAPAGLHALARIHGIQTAYHDHDGRRITASPESLMAALRALRVPLMDAADIRRLLDHRARRLQERVLEPVIVQWLSERELPRDGGEPPAGHAGFAIVRLPARDRDAALEVTITREEGGEAAWGVAAAGLEVVERDETDGREYVALELPLPVQPPGYHDIQLRVGRGRWSALLISAPRRAAGWDALPTPDGAASDRHWGLFAPLYSVPGGPPTFATLDRLAEATAAAGGSVVGTLPLLSAFLGQRIQEVSPYAPASRLFWNELYLSSSADDWPARDLGGSRVYADLERAMSARRPALEAEARSYFAGHEPDAGEAPDAGEDARPGPAELPELAAFRARNPRADDYARFRAVAERRGAWPDWQERLRARDLRPGDWDPDTARYHLYVQMRAERELAEAAERARARGVSLYLDLPLGVHPHGYDVWRERSLFAAGASAGAPPDPLAPGGQDWGFPPLHPEAVRLDRYRYLVACIRKQLRFAGVLRIDHVMQLHRMFWVPDGDAGHGVYVRYPADELWAVVCLESYRAGAVVIGEDLGTVPRDVRRAMRTHGVPGMWVAQFELAETTTGSTSTSRSRSKSKSESESTGAVLVPKRVPRGAAASIGTHDTPMFAAWWTGRDAEIRSELGLMDEEAAEAEVTGRADLRRKLLAGLRQLAPDVEPSSYSYSYSYSYSSDDAARGTSHRDSEATETLARLYAYMGRSDAGLVLAAMEDLWLETEPQNVPGTVAETNWRRRASRSVEALSEEGTAWMLEILNRVRRGGTE